MPRRNSCQTIVLEPTPPKASISSPRIFSASHRPLERPNQPRPGSAEFVAVGNRKLREQLFAARRHNEPHLAPIGAAARASNPAACFQTAAQLHRAVVTNLEALGQNAHGCFPSAGPPFDGQESLVLLRLDTGRARSALAEIQERANFIAEVGERLVVNPSGCPVLHHPKYIVSRYKV